MEGRTNTVHQKWCSRHHLQVLGMAHYEAMPSTSSVCGESQQSYRSQEVEVMPAIQTKLNSDQADQITTWLWASLAPGELFLCCVHCTDHPRPKLEACDTETQPWRNQPASTTLSTHTRLLGVGVRGERFPGRTEVVQGAASPTLKFTPRSILTAPLGQG